MLLIYCYWLELFISSHIRYQSVYMLGGGVNLNGLGYGRFGLFGSVNSFTSIRTGVFTGPRFLNITNGINIVTRWFICTLVVNNLTLEGGLRSSKVSLSVVGCGGLFSIALRELFIPGKLGCLSMSMNLISPGVVINRMVSYLVVNDSVCKYASSLFMDTNGRVYFDFSLSMLSVDFCECLEVVDNEFISTLYLRTSGKYELVSIPAYLVDSPLIDIGCDFCLIPGYMGLPVLRLLARHPLVHLGAFMLNRLDTNHAHRVKRRLEMEESVFDSQAVWFQDRLMSLFIALAYQCDYLSVGRSRAIVHLLSRIMDFGNPLCIRVLFVSQGSVAPVGKNVLRIGK